MGENVWIEFNIPSRPVLSPHFGPLWRGRCKLVTVEWVASINLQKKTFTKNEVKFKNFEASVMMQDNAYYDLSSKILTWFKQALWIYVKFTFAM